VARALSVGLSLLARRGMRIQITEVNGQPGAVAIDAHGRLYAVMGLDIADGQIQTIHAIANPDKLRHLDQAGHLSALLRARRRTGDDG
jgi:hypothetical protein